MSAVCSVGISEALFRPELMFSKAVRSHSTKPPAVKQPAEHIHECQYCTQLFGRLSNKVGHEEEGGVAIIVDDG